MASLAEELANYHSEITKYLHIGYSHWDDLVARVKRQKQTCSHDFDDEQIWTFWLLADMPYLEQQEVLKVDKWRYVMDNGYLR